MGEHIFTDVVLSYITLILGVGVFQKQSYACTLGNFYLAGHLMETVYTRDWFHCFLVCHNEPKCVSYNFNKQYGICDLNDHGIEDSDNVHIKLTRKPGTFFHQIRVRDFGVTYQHPWFLFFNICTLVWIVLCLFFARWYVNLSLDVLTYKMCIFFYKIVLERMLYSIMSRSAFQKLFG